MNKIERFAVGVAGVWLLLVLAIMALALMSPARAAEIPSSASGRYATTAGECSVVFARFGADHVNVDLWCPGTYSHSTAYAFGGACIGGPGVAYAFPLHGPSPAGPWVAFDALVGGTLQVRRGANALQLYQGGGTAETWTRIEALPSPAPYTCGPPPVPARSRSLHCTVVNPSSPYCRG